MSSCQLVSGVHLCTAFHCQMVLSRVGKTPRLEPSSSFRMMVHTVSLEVIDVDCVGFHSDVQFMRLCP